MFYFNSAFIYYLVLEYEMDQYINFEDSYEITHFYNNSPVIQTGIKRILYLNSRSIRNKLDRQLHWLKGDVIKF